MFPPNVILRELTDEALADPNGTYQGEVRVQLLRLPAEWRQSAVAEDHRRTFVMSNGEWKWTSPDPNPISVVVDEILVQIGEAEQ
jgi:hypothetical protein